MAGVNKVILVGNIGRDPEVRYAQSGDKIVNFTMATSESWRDKSSGERRERTEWHRIVIFNQGLCDVAEKYLKKGSKVYVEGQLQTRKWTGNDGVEKYTTEIVLKPFRGEIQMLDTRSGGGGGSSESSAGTSSGDGSHGSFADEGEGSSSGGGGPDFDDEIPF